LASAGSSNAARMAMMAMTTRSSMSVNAGRDVRCLAIFTALFLLHRTRKSPRPQSKNHMTYSQIHGHFFEPMRGWGSDVKRFCKKTAILHSRRAQISLDGERVPALVNNTSANIMRVSAASNPREIRHWRELWGVLEFPTHGVDAKSQWAGIAHRYGWRVTCSSNHAQSV